MERNTLFCKDFSYIYSSILLFRQEWIEMLQSSFAFNCYIVKLDDENQIRVECGRLKILRMFSCLFRCKFHFRHILVNYLTNVFNKLFKTQIRFLLIGCYHFINLSSFILLQSYILTLLLSPTSGIYVIYLICLWAWARV